jgi:short-subunit dehydrogenase
MTTVLITGAAGGLGTIISEHLAKNEFELFLLDNDNKALSVLVNKISNNKIIHTICADVSDYDQLKESLKNINNLDILINCAGVSGPAGPFLENNITKWNEAIKINLFGTTNLCHILISKLQKSVHGKIINFAGGGSAYPRKHQTAYASSKAAVVRFTETLSAEYPDLDINVISPGPFKTKIWDEQIHEKEPEKWGDKKRLNEFIKFLCSEKSNHLTGKFIHTNDNWEEWDYKELPGDMYTLRRVDNLLLHNLKKEITKIKT